MIEFLIYFFNKSQNIYKKKNKGKECLNIKNFDLNKLQEELIELENYMISLRNEKVNSEGKYTKLVEIQSKMTESDNLDNSRVHVDTVKKLNGKIFDLTEQNKYLT